MLILLKKLVRIKSVIKLTVLYMKKNSNEKCIFYTLKARNIQNEEYYIIYIIIS